MRFSVLGASGQVGSNLVDVLSRPGNSVDTTRIDISDDFLMHRHFFISDVVYLSAAKTSVDHCEIDPTTIKTNFGGVRNVVDAIKRSKYQPTLVFYSTDYVFDGVRGAYNESCLPSPINRYGYQKLLAEQFIQANLEKYYIIRTNMVYGPDPGNKNYACRMMASLKQFRSQSIDGIFDEWVTPTYGPDLAQKSFELVRANATYGVYHIAGPEMMTRYQFLLKLAKVVDVKEEMIVPITSASLKRPAARPLNGGLTSTNNFMTTTTVNEGLKQLKEVMK